MSNYKITAVISVSGVKTDDDAVNLLEHLLYVWDEQKGTFKGWEKTNVDISVKTITEN